MRRFFLSVLVISVTVLGLLGIQPAPVYAASPGCNAVNGLSVTGTGGYTTGVYQFSAGETIVYTLTWSFPGATVTSASAYISIGATTVASATVSNPTTSVTVPYTFPADQSTAVRLDWAFSLSGPVGAYSVTMTLRCGGGQGWEGPGIPAGFVMKHIICNVAAVQSPGGPVVPNIKPLVPGATWYMSPTPVKDAKGKLWTEVFLGGWNNAFIPAECATW
jgi:hypothetical protein